MQIPFSFAERSTFDADDEMDWETPKELFNALDREFHFTLDVCAASHNTKCDHFLSKEQNGLNQDWSGEVCWMNPPYGSETEQWMKKAWEESQWGATVVCLVPAWTDRIWFHKYAQKGELRFIQGRVKFGRGGPSKFRCKFPLMIVVFQDEGED